MPCFSRFGESGQHVLHECDRAESDPHAVAEGLLPLRPARLHAGGPGQAVHRLRTIQAVPS